MTFIEMHRCIQFQVHPPIFPSLLPAWGRYIEEKTLWECFCSNGIEAHWIASLSSRCYLLLLSTEKWIVCNSNSCCRKLHIPAIKACFWLKCSIYIEILTFHLSSSSSSFSLLFDYLHFSSQQKGFSCTMRKINNNFFSRLILNWKL